MKTLFGEDREKVQKVVDIIQADLRRHYTINDLAEMTFMNREKLRELFAAVYNKGPYEFLSDLRLEKAKTMLLEGSGMRRISLSIGFQGDYAETNFIRFFKKKTGITPNQWKHQHHKLTG